MEIATILSGAGVVVAVTVTSVGVISIRKACAESPGARRTAMSEEQVVRNCPHLGGAENRKPVRLPLRNREDLLDFLRSPEPAAWEERCPGSPLRIRQGRALIYLYRPARLEKDLSCASCEALLSEFGYNCRGGSRCLTRLARRLKQQEDFPHEIGLFLSYPPEDVKGFLEHRPCKCVGCWKVYENEEAARKTFAKYKSLHEGLLPPACQRDRHRTAYSSRMK